MRPDKATIERGTRLTSDACPGTFVIAQRKALIKKGMTLTSDCAVPAPGLAEIRARLDRLGVGIKEVSEFIRRAKAAS